MILFLIVLNALAFVIEAAGPTSLIDRFALWPLRPATADAPVFQLWQLLTYSVLHANLAHLVFNMLGLFMFGSEVERALGASRTLKLYVASVVCGGIAQVLTALTPAGDAHPAIGASAGVFGILVAYALIFPKRRVVLLFPPIPMPAWLFATGYALVELLLGVSRDAPGVAHFAHLGGMAGAVLLISYWSRKPRHDAVE
ncbi:rhomboid family intramembrane serine protease [Paraburkholderia sp. LEh10]|jgi:membrane associated rhomboid family serine protease|uniref:rhomboid family intramembrane serine protease n=1 Tax=Paraburkholderia sp. LEh10 TaxID=2821353 RepID=UPI001AE2F8CF|nr:rhomboid family intramembrane serine protease [Paraburkholderia sp. LEh10]MBP0590845.1 rhomboid family intramembrane serine protease [Paraburkholderia sp. LEh10]